MLFVDELCLITLLLFADVFQLWNTYKMQPKFDVTLLFEPLYLITLLMFAHVIQL